MAGPLLSRPRRRLRTPEWLSVLIRHHVNMVRYDLRKWELLNPLSHITVSDDNRFNLTRPIGIVKEYSYYHTHYVQACLELGVPFRVVDITCADWIDWIRRSGINTFLVWPSSALSLWKETFDDRLRIMAEELGLTVYPSVFETWIYENKQRMHHWLTACELPQPRTWVFYNEDELMEFVRRCELPVVYKSSTGAAAQGVRIFRDESRYATGIVTT